MAVEKGRVRRLLPRHVFSAALSLIGGIYAPPGMEQVVGSPSNVYVSVKPVKGGYAFIYVFEWPYQLFPPHKYDYEPVIVFTDTGFNVKEVYVDGYHYYVSRYVAPPGTRRVYLVVDTPWRSMKVRWGEPDGMVRVYPGNGTRVRLLTRHALASLYSRRENPFAVNPRIIRNPEIIRRAKHWEFIHSPSVSEIVEDFAKNYGIKMSRLDAALFIAAARLKQLYYSLVSRVYSLLTSLRRRVERIGLGDVTFANAS